MQGLCKIIPEGMEAVLGVRVSTNACRSDYKECPINGRSIENKQKQNKSPKTKDHKERVDTTEK